MKYLLPIVFLGLIVWVHYILYIGDERKMVDCSDFKTFIKEQNRMCQSLTDPKVLCPLKQGLVSWFCDECEGMCFQEADFAIRTVQKWSDEHPLKTRQSELLKMFPNMRCLRNERGESYIDFCPKSFDSTLRCRKDGSGSCPACMKEYWLAEVE